MGTRLRYAATIRLLIGRDKYASLPRLPILRFRFKLHCPRESLRSTGAPPAAAATRTLHHPHHRWLFGADRTGHENSRCWLRYISGHPVVLSIRWRGAPGHRHRRDLLREAGGRDAYRKLGRSVVSRRVLRHGNRESDHGTLGGIRLLPEMGIVPMLSRL